MTLSDAKVREWALRAQYGTEAANMLVPSSISGEFTPATFRPPSMWYAGLFHESQWYADRGYYQLEEVPGAPRLPVPNDDANWAFRDGYMYNLRDWRWPILENVDGGPYRVVYVVLFGEPSGFTAWEFIKLNSTITVSKNSYVGLNKDNIKVIPDKIITTISPM